MATTTATPDVIVENQGSLFLFHLLTDAAWSWLAENIPEESTYWGDALVVEPRYAGNLADGMQSDGLTLE